MVTRDELVDEVPERAMSAAAGAASAGAWARQGRHAIQGSHELLKPLARWVLEPAPSPAEPGTSRADGEEGLPIAIPEPVLHCRPPQRLPEDAFCRSPIAGVVITVMVAAGQEVKRRQPALIVEAMKMQNQVSPEVDGVVKTVCVAPGDAVKAGQVLFELK